MAAKIGHKKIGGRKKGTVNKTTKQLKDMILLALDKAGGIKYLKKQAKENPTAFMTLIGKVLPMQMTGLDGEPMEHKWTIEIMKAKQEGEE